MHTYFVTLENPLNGYQWTEYVEARSEADALRIGEAKGKGGKAVKAEVQS